MRSSIYNSIQVQCNSPIALFTFKRPLHTRRTLESLALNPEFQSSPLFIYCDGARNASEVDVVEVTRKLIRDWPHPNKTIIERDRNWGLANSVIEGVTQLCKQYGRVIVVEDDLVVSPVFLNYLNTALIRYADEPKVMQVSGYMFPLDANQVNKAQLLPITSTWGWATWDRAWKKFDASTNENTSTLLNSKKKLEFNLDGAYPYTRRLKQQLNGKSDSWGIRWYLSVFNAGGLVLYPPYTFVQNIGHDGSGTHCKIENNHDYSTKISADSNVDFPIEICISNDCYTLVKKYLKNQYSPASRALIFLKTELSNFLKKLKE